MDNQRRILIKGALGGAAIAAAMGAGLLAPRAVLAAWPKSAFEAKGLDNAVKAMWSGNTLNDSDAIEIKAPDIAENGAVVPVTVQSAIPGIRSITVLVEGNQTPLAASFRLAENAKGLVSTRVKMGKTSNLVAVVEAGGKFYTTRKEVKVTIGGCGG